MNLEQENKILKKKLEHAQAWMLREVAHKNSMQLTEKISQDVCQFFPPEALSFLPEHALENIISSELIYHDILTGKEIDGMGMILGYQKILDSMVELYITKGFRKYVQKHDPIISPQNIPLEKSLYSVVEKKYILSLGRLFALLKNMQKNTSPWHYENEFRNFLKDKKHLKKALLESDFLLQWERLMSMQVTGEKRHSWMLSRENSLRARNIFIWDFHDTHCLLYILAQSQCVDI
jgi:hypothetical protein